MYALLDPTNCEPAVKTFAQTLKAKFQIALQSSLEQTSVVPTPIENDGLTESDSESESVDILDEYKKRAIQAFCDNDEFLEKNKDLG